MKKHSAFSLIELSIVILVISVLLAGILQGQSLVSKSKLRGAQMQTVKSPVADIPDLAAWYETTSARSFDTSESIDGNTVSTWYDISPQALAGANGTQSDSAHKPLYKTNVENGLPMLKFDTTAYRYFTLPDGTIPYGNTNYTIFIVSKAATSTCGLCAIIFSGSTTSSNGQLSIYYNLDTILDGWNGNDATANNSTTNLHIFSSVYNSSVGRTIYVDGQSGSNYSNTNRSSLSTNNAIGGSLGHSGGLDGYIGEIIIFNRYLKTEERKAVEKYLGRKWSVTVS